MKDVKKKITVTRWDVAEFLHNEEDYAGYLTAAFEDGDPVIIKKAMENVARARNMAALARDMGISTRGLYKALSPDGNPEFSTIQKFLGAIGARLAVVPEKNTPTSGPARRRSGLARATA